MPLHLDEFKQEEFQGYIESVPPARQYALASFFPKKNVFDVEFAYNIISGSYGQMASITGLDAGAPLRDKETLARMTGELTKVQHGYRLTEKELLMFNRPRMDEEKKQAVEAVYNNSDRLVRGVYDREEWMRAKATYEGKMSYAEKDIVIDVDFLIPEENKINTSKVWSDATATILEDLKGAIEAFEDANNGESPEVMHISPAVETYFLKNEQIKAQIYGTSTDNRVVTADQVAGLFTSLDIPPYVIVKDRVRGANGMEKLMPEGRVVLLASDLGHTMYGPTVEKNYNPGIYVIPQIQTTNPPKQEVFVGESVFPALERPQAIVHLNVTAEAQA
jgi:hypothetical protein